MKKYFRLWWIYTKAAAQLSLESRLGAVFFLVGKFLRFLLMFYFLYILLSQTKSLQNYTFWQVIFFYATFSLIDGIPQFLLREVYRFRRHVMSGYFDYVLLQPQKTLFKSLFAGSDVLDIPLLIFSFGLLIYSAFQIGPVNLTGVILYILLFINSLVIALSFHIFVLGLGILTTEVDNSIMLFRDITRMGQMPITIYQYPISFIITFIIPVGIMMTFPVQAMLGLLAPYLVVLSFGFGLIFIFLSYTFWKYALLRYQSVSS